MSKFVAIAYDTVAHAEETRLKLLKMQDEFLVTLDDIVVAYKDDKGKVRLHQAVDMTGAGAVSGSFWGLLIGMIFMTPLFGMVTGLAFGALSGALTDIGINDDMMKELAASLKPGGAILFVLVRDMTEDKVLAELEGSGGKVMKTSLSHEDENLLQASLDKARQTTEAASTP